MHDFASASRAVVHTLRSHFGFDLWMVTRAEGNDWIVLAVEDSRYGTKEGSVFKWSDSFCSRMGVRASIGLAGRNPELGLRSACAEAAGKMYEEKRLRQNPTG